jgi:hypothetical protein
MEAITFETEDGLKLEGEVHLPDQAPIGSAVLCHPHPQYGGSKDHPLLWAIRIDLVRRGFAVLLFNFRGVMGSEGSYGGGIHEVKDVRAAIGRAGAEADGPTFLCGWSFGAHVALRTALDDERVAALALVALPLHEATVDLPSLPDITRADRLQTLDRPVLLLAGDGDPFCPIPNLLVVAGRLPRSTVEIVANADHYFAKREREAARIVGSFAERTLRKRPGGQ